MTDFWDTIATADPNDQNDYFKEGEYEVTLEGVKSKMAGHRGDSLIFTFVVISSTNPEVESGTYRTRVLKLSGKNASYAPGEIKQLISAIFNKNPEDKGEWGKQCVQIARDMTGPANPLQGKRLHLSAFDRPNQSQSGKVWTKHNWYPSDPGQAVASPPPPPAPAERYHPEGTSPGHGATHRLVENAWVLL